MSKQLPWRLTPALVFVMLLAVACGRNSNAQGNSNPAAQVEATRVANNLVDEIKAPSGSHPYTGRRIVAHPTAADFGLQKVDARAERAWLIPANPYIYAAQFQAHPPMNLATCSDAMACQSFPVTKLGQRDLLQVQAAWTGKDPEINNASLIVSMVPMGKGTSLLQVDSGVATNPARSFSELASPADTTVQVSTTPSGTNRARTRTISNPEAVAHLRRLFNSMNTWTLPAHHNCPVEGPPAVRVTFLNKSGVDLVAKVTSCDGTHVTRAGHTLTTLRDNGFAQVASMMLTG